MEAQSRAAASGSASSAIPPAGNEDVNPLAEPDPTVPVVDDIEELRQRLALMTPTQITQVQMSLRNAEVDAEGKIEFMGKKISAALRKQYIKMTNEAMKSAKPQAGLQIRG